MRHQLRGSPLAVPILIFFVLALSALLLRLLLSGLPGLPALLSRTLPRLATLLAKLPARLALSRLSALLTVLFLIICHGNTPPCLQRGCPRPRFLFLSKI